MFSNKSILSLLCVLAAALLCLSSCGAGSEKETPSDAGTAVTTAADETSAPAGQADAEAVKLGEGDNNFAFAVTFEDGSVKNYDISTNETTVGAALVALGLIDGEQGEFGLYVKSVDGVSADYTTDGAYWSFTVDGETAMAGVDMTDIVSGSSYGFVYTKA